MSRIAFITGITGQDGSYLSELLVDKGYKVHGLIRRVSQNNNTKNIQHILNHPNLTIHNGDMTDSCSLIRVLHDIENTIDASVERFEIYNLAAQSHVQISFDSPEYTMDTNGFGPLCLLEYIRNSKYKNIIRLYQASTSELYGKIQGYPQNENTPFYPRSPYAVSKLYGFWIVKNYREAYNIYAVNGILFNHESPRRGKDFVTRKITNTIGKILRGEIQTLELGNLDSKRDWGHAKDYVEGMWRILQTSVANDYVLATNEVHSVREFCEIAFLKAGLNITWKGAGYEEEGYDQNNILRVKVSKKYYRPAEVDILCGDSSKAEKDLNWQRKYTFETLIQEMINSDVLLAK
jgi:GDPmannose 4,6-dehydratase